MNKYIAIILFLGFFIFGESCTSNQSKKEVKPNITDIVCSQEKKVLEYSRFSIEKWIEHKCDFHSINGPKSLLIKKAFSIFQDRVNLYISENTEYSIDFLDDEEDWTKYSNNIIMGYISLKSLEQILNLEITKHNTNNINNIDNRINTISINYPTSILSPDAKEYIKEAFNQIDDLDIKKKEKKKLFYEVIFTEILKQYSIEIEKQCLFSQF